MDELFDRPRLGGVGGSWIKHMPPDCRAWVDELVDKIVEYGKEPNSWGEVHRRLKERWPDTTPTTQHPIVQNIRRLVEQRRG